MKDCSVSVALEKTEPTGVSQKGTNFKAIEGRDFKHWVGRGCQSLEVILWLLELHLSKKLREGFQRAGGGWGG